MAKKFGLRSQYGFLVPLRPDQLLFIRQDKKYSNMSHIKTTQKDKDGKNIWFTVQHSAEEIFKLYYNNK